MTIVYAVFNSDGCECSDLVGVFDTKKEAQLVAAQVEYFPRELHSHLWDGRKDIEWMGSVAVEEITVGKCRLPMGETWLSKMNEGRENAENHLSRGQR